jgi:hypothetical protein
MSLPSVRIKSLLSALSTVLAPIAIWGQNAQCPTYFVPLVVRNAQGELVHNYSAKDVAVKVNGKVVNVDEIRRDQRSRRIVIVLDASASMNRDGNGNPWHQAVASASLLASLAKGRAYLALLVFNEKVVEEIGLDRSNSAVEERLMFLQSNRDLERTLVHGKTSINDAIYRAVTLLGDSTTADAIYVVSDGEDTSSRKSAREVEQTLSVTGIRVFADILKPPREAGYSAPLPELLGTGPDFFEFARLTGGANIQADPEEARLSFNVRPKISAVDAARLFFAAMFENEILQFKWSNPGAKKRGLKISTSEIGSGHLPGVQLFYPQQLYSCTQTSNLNGAF